MTRPLVSVIVPTLNERKEVSENLAPLRDDPVIEVIVVDAKEVGRANRAFQMNKGARRSRGDLLVFLHADTKVDPADLIELSQLMNRKSELVGGAFRFALDSESWKARVVEFGVRLREWVFRLPYGDQAIFVRRSVFEEIGGYPDVPLLEDVLLVKKLLSPSPIPLPSREGVRGRGFLYFPRRAITSARRWEKQGYLKTTLVNWTTMILWRLGVSLETIINFRRRVFNDAVRGDTQKTSARNHAGAA